MVFSAPLIRVKMCSRRQASCLCFGFMLLTDVSWVTVSGRGLNFLCCEKKDNKAKSLGEQFEGKTH